MKLSACVITYNEADRIDRCLSALTFCDEILVVDSLSTDATVALATARGARVLSRPFTGYRSQKQFAVEQARHEWILCVDADEVVTDPLREEILALRAEGFQQHAGWSIPRMTEYAGRFLRHGNAWPDRIVRLFDRRRGQYAGREVHEHVRVEGTVGRIAAPLEHYSYRDLDDHLTRMSRYATLMAESLHESGRSVTAPGVWLRPWWRFLRGMLIKAGVLDGWRGFAFHLVEARYVREKYLRVWLAQREAGRSFLRPGVKSETMQRRQ
ncbi:MAG: glycosyltransferase family 2 protein [Steroidobacteraceae bacterium]